MIGYLKGNIIADTASEIILDVNGVGYRVRVNEFFSEEQSEVELFIYTSVSERAIDLYGFSDPLQLRVFELLLNVSGIGPKKAMDILAKTDANSLLQNIAFENTDNLKASGISKNTAEKIVIELRTKVQKMNKDFGSVQKDSSQSSIYVEVVEGLSVLGYTKQEIDEVLKEINIDEYDSSSSLIKDILNYLR